MSDELPGIPLASGFEHGQIVNTDLPADAKARVLAKMDSVAEARRRAAETGMTYVIG